MMEASTTLNILSTIKLVNREKYDTIGLRHRFLLTLLKTTTP